MNEKQKADVVAEIRRGFFNRNAQDKVISAFAHKVGYRTATQEDAAAYAERLGENLSKTLREIYGRRSSFDGWKAISDEEQVYALAKDLIDPLMRLTHTMVNDAGAQAQKIADEAIGLGIRSVVGEYPGERLNGLYRKIAEAAVKDREVQRAVSGEQVSRDSKREWRGGKPIGTGEQKQDAGTVESWLGEPVVNNVQAFYDEHVRANAEARFRMGLGPVIVRTAAPGCCAWCAKLSGVYDYDEVGYSGNDVFRRHERCRCTVTYQDKGTVQDIWSKRIYKADEATLARRAAYGLEDKRGAPEYQEIIINEGKKEEKALAKSEKHGRLDIEIDEFVPCLKDLKTGEILQTEVRDIPRKSLKGFTEKNGWGIDWVEVPENYKVLGVFIKGQNDPQGMIELKFHRGGVEMKFASTAPQNNKLIVGNNKRYEGVGGHLFAAAVQESLNAGNPDGCVFGDAANEDLLRHYITKFGAEHLPIGHEYHIVIDGPAAQRLIDQYTFERK